jgi:hypothetical protein
MSVSAAEIDETNRRRIIRGNSLLLADIPQRGVDVREMRERKVANKGAIDFVVAHAAMQPAQKHYELHAGGSDGGC